MKKNYRKETYKTREEWLKNRGIGGSDAAAIVNKSKWSTPNDVYNRIVYKREKVVPNNSRMVEGTLAEEHIRELWALDHPNYEVIRPPKRNHWIFRRKDYPLLTCTPDSLAKKDGKLYGIEIKDVELIKTDVKQMWESNTLPDQYYFQVLHYMVVMGDLDGVCLTAHLKYFTHNDETDEWMFDYAIDRSYWIYREDVIEHIKYLDGKEIDFIENNINKKQQPKLIFKWS